RDKVIDAAIVAGTAEVLRVEIAHSTGLCFSAVQQGAGRLLPRHARSESTAPVRGTASIDVAMQHVLVEGLQETVRAAMIGLVLRRGQDLDADVIGRMTGEIVSAPSLHSPGIGVAVEQSVVQLFDGVVDVLRAVNEL